MPPHRRRPTLAALAAGILAALSTLLLPAAPAAAHNSLGTASPARDARLTAPPTEVALVFLQTLNPAFTTIVLSDSERRKLPTGEPVIDGAKATLPVTGTLPNGSYTVAYRVVSVDGHPVQGSYTFTVADPTSSSAPPVPAPAAAPGQSADGNGSTPLLIVGGVLTVFAVAAMVLLRRRRRRG